MKKIIQIVATLVLAVGFAVTGTGSVQAQSNDCDVLIINGTGSGSNNQVECTTTVDVTVECVNNVYVLDSNSQTAVSGAAVSGGNVTGGTAITGNATNTNGQTVSIGANCGTQTVPTTPVTPQTPPTAAVPPKKVAALPFTSGNSTFETVLVSAIALITIAISARFAVVAYRRLALK